MRFPIPCVIFAGGKSSRMGRDKALLPFGGYDTLAEYQYRRLSVCFPTIYISAKGNKFPFEAPLIPDNKGKDLYAPTLGLQAAFERLQSDFFVLSVDTPFVEEKEIAEIYEAYRREERDAVIARSPSGIHPMCGIYTVKMIPKLKKMMEQGIHRLNHLLKNSDTLFVDFSEEEPFYNINTPQQYEAVIRH
ncbi:molybdenum cofactor guanylyltransferase MobA [Hydrogenimonas urashimensis]|uniref:molybdenum cofactor guanylyltransferase MobA n=1 Tax=Hydrogenimonas urashimensis TaxID=2740515 RepID=UPI0019167B4E|nr:molybdenum cofactor guanylyltransferase MobA [Hydrogenimonas urashimensis]